MTTMGAGVREGAAVCALLVALPLAAAGQMGLGFGGGPTFPLGGVADQTNRGFNAAAFFHVPAPLLPVRIQSELFIQQLPDVQEGNYREVALLLAVRVGGKVAPGPYALLGTGVYRGRFSPDAERFQDGVFLRTGWHGGVGYALNLPGMSLYVESRLHGRNAGERYLRFLPLTFGLLF